MQRLRFGFIATGTIARRLAQTMQLSSTCELIAAASRSQEKARAFAADFEVEAVAGYENLLSRDDVDAVYIATPHPQHREWCLRAIAHGKHVLCEKPLAMNLAEAEELFASAKERGVLLVEAFMYRFHPQTQKLVELLAGGTIGQVRWISAAFGFAAAADADPQGRLFANALGGGGVLDVGCYTVSMARLLAGAVVGEPFLEPLSVRAMGRLNPSENTDWMAGALLNFPGDLLATVRCATRLKIGHRVRVEGTEGTLDLNEPWFAGHPDAAFRIDKASGETIIPTADAHDLYSFMLDDFAACVRAGRTESERMSAGDSLGNLRVLEDWYGQIGVEYR